jgi:hypothetical protein
VDLFSKTSKFVTSSVVALSILVLSGVAVADGHSNGKSGTYVATSFAMGNFGDIDAKYRSSGTVKWALEDMKGGTVELGHDFGEFRVSTRITAMSGGVDKIAATDVTADSDDAIMGIATLNAYWDIIRENISDDLYITPYVGLAVGATGGFMRGTNGGADDGQTGGGDDRSGVGAAYGGHAGLFLEVTENIGLTSEYTMIHASKGSNNIHMANVGLRLTF